MGSKRAKGVIPSGRDPLLFSPFYNSYAAGRKASEGHDPVGAQRSGPPPAPGAAGGGLALTGFALDLHARLCLLSCRADSHMPLALPGRAGRRAPAHQARLCTFHLQQWMFDIVANGRSGIDVDKVGGHSVWGTLERLACQRALHARRLAACALSLLACMVQRVHRPVPRN